MGRVVPAGIKDPFVQLPGGMLLFHVDALEEGTLGENNILAYQAKLTVVEPESVAGVQHTETFFIGTEEDPDAELEDTWIKRAGRLKIFVEKCGVAFEGSDMDMVCSEVKDHDLLGRVTQKLEPNIKKGQPNPYAGRVRAQISAFYAQGEHEVALSDAEPTQMPDTPANGSAGRPAPRAMTTAPARPAAPAARPAAPAAPVRPQAAAPAPAAPRRLSR